MEPYLPLFCELAGGFIYQTWSVRSQVQVIATLFHRPTSAGQASLANSTRALPCLTNLLDKAIDSYFSRLLMKKNYQIMSAFHATKSWMKLTGLKTHVLPPTRN